MATRTLSRNLPYINQQISALLVNTSPSVKFICIVTIFGYLLSFSETAVKALSVTPGYILPPQFCIWTAFTFCFLELYLWEVFLDIIIVGLCGKLIEPLWVRTLRYFIILIICWLIADSLPGTNGNDDVFRYYKYWSCRFVINVLFICVFLHKRWWFTVQCSYPWTVGVCGGCLCCRSTSHARFINRQNTHRKTYESVWDFLSSHFWIIG